MSALLPPLLLLAWSALAATTITALVAAPLLGQPAAALALAPRSPRTGRALLLGLLGYPLAYLLGFSLLGKATLLAGAALGLLHAACFAILALRRGGRALLRAGLPRMLLYVLYGAMLGFAFVTP